MSHERLEEPDAVVYELAGDALFSDLATTSVTHQVAFVNYLIPSGGNRV